jgi:thimet oligopeptidase
MFNNAQGNFNPLIERGFNAPIQYDKLMVEHITEFRIEIEKKINRLLKEHFSDPEKPYTFTNTVYALDSIYDLMWSPFGALAELHPDENVRKTCQEEGLILDSIGNAISHNIQIYKKLIVYADSKEAGDLTESRKKYLHDRIREFERNGIHLTGENKQQYLSLLSDMSRLKQAFFMNCQMARDTFYTTKEKLAGLSQEFLKTHKLDDGRYFIIAQTPDYEEVMQKVHNADIRKEIYYLNRNYAFEKNNAILNLLLAARHKQAKILGYDNYADYKLETLMARNSKNVEEFHSKLLDGLKELSDSQTIKYMEIKGEQDFFPWDRQYYRQLYMDEQYDLDTDQIKEYFPVEKVLDGLLEISEGIFDIVFVPRNDLSAWHHDIRIFEIQKNGKTISYIYFDLNSRPGKMSQGAMMITSVSAKGERIPQITIACAFPDEDPCLLQPADIKTLLHEFGHAVHRLFTDVEMVLQTGFMLERDFTEGPSQFCELWSFQEEVLKRLSGHYKTGERLSDDLIEKIIHIQKEDQISRVMRLMHVAILDQIIHSEYQEDNPLEYKKIEKYSWKRLFLLPYPEMTKNILTRFFIIAIEPYASVMYGFNWSLVYAADIYSLFKEDGVLSNIAGERYRKHIVAPGSTKPAAELLKDYLGREPNQYAFMEFLGI